MLICWLSPSDFMLFLPSDLKERLWMDLHSGAESGWDFSSRWYTAGGDRSDGTLRGTRTSQILPTDLNALLCLNEKRLAAFHRILGEYASGLRPLRADQLTLVCTLLLAFYC